MNKRIDKLLEEASEWRLLSLLFECPNEDWKNEVTDLGSQVRDSDLRKAARRAVRDGTEGKYHSIFGPGGPAPAREVSYRSWVQPGYLLSELRSYYEAFRFEPKTKETPDHVSVETDFLAYLKLKEAFAISVSEPENSRITSDAANKFKQDHLAKVAAPLADSLKSSGEEYLSLAASLLLKRTGPDKDPSIRTFLPVMNETDEDNFECGSLS